MNSSLQKAFDRLEASLATLLESVTANNPSPPAALALVAADDEVSAQLDKLVTHQQNHVRLQRLRHLSSLLDAELTNLLTILSNTRSEIISVPSTQFNKEEYRKVDYAALLAYATKISRYTKVAAAAVPVEDATALGGANNGAEGGTGEAGGANAGGNGAATTGGGDVKPDAGGDKAGNVQQQQQQQAQQQQQQQQQQQKGKGKQGDGKAEDPKNANGGGAAAGVAADGAGGSGDGGNKPADNSRLRLTHEESALVDPSSGMPFAPWPSEQIIQRSLLSGMDFQDVSAEELIEKRRQLLQQGVSGALQPQDEQQQRLEVADRPQGPTGAAKPAQEGVEKAQIQGVDRERERQREAEAAAAQESEKKAAVFTGLDLYDPDQED